MKAYRNLLIIILVILLLGGGLYAVTKFEPKTDEEVSATLPPTVTIFKTEKDKIESVTVTNPKEQYTLKKQGATWVVTKDASVVLDQSRVESLLYECANIAGQALVSDSVQDLVQYGLDQPQRTVEIVLHDGTVKKVLIGHTTFEHSVSYLMVEGETKVYTKSTSGCETLTGSLSALMNHEIYTMDASVIGKVTIERSGGETIKLDRVKMSVEGHEDAYSWTVLAPIQKEANTYRIEEELLTNLLSQTAVSVIPIPKAGQNYGFQNPRAVYTITSLDQTESYTLTVGREEGENTFISKKGDKSVYLVATDKLDFLNLSYIDLIDKLVHIENIKDVSEIRLSGLGKSYTMTISAAENAVYTINDKEIKDELFKKAYQSVIGLVLDDYTTAGGGDTAFTITYEKRDGSQVTVKCLNYDDRNYLVKVNGKGNLLIRKKQVDNMIATIDSVLAQ